MEPVMRLALFDFDGTITERDSFADFLLTTFGLPRCLLAAVIMAPHLVRGLTRRVSGSAEKEAVFRHFFRGWPADKFEMTAKCYSIERLPLLVRDTAMERILWHRSQGHRMVVVSASVESWLRPWCNENGMEVIGTRLEASDGILTGRIDGRNCQGREKERRIRQAIDLGKYDRVYAYGNSRGDQHMLALADERYYNWVRTA